MLSLCFLISLLFKTWIAHCVLYRESYFQDYLIFSILRPHLQSSAWYLGHFNTGSGSREGQAEMKRCHCIWTQHDKNSGEKYVKMLNRRATKNDLALKNKPFNESHHLSKFVREKTEELTWLLSQCLVFNFADKVIASSPRQGPHMLQVKMKSLSLTRLTAESFSHVWHHTDSQSVIREEYPPGDTGQKASAK